MELGRVGKSLWENYGAKCLLGLGFLATAALSFWAGWLQHSLIPDKPLIIRVAEPVPAQTPTPSLLSTEPDVRTQGNSQQEGSEVKEACQYVGSKKSTKYHHPASRCAKQIKATNKLCFASADAAKAKGYTPGCLEPS